MHSGPKYISTKPPTCNASSIVLRWVLRCYYHYEITIKLLPWCITAGWREASTKKFHCILVNWITSWHRNKICGLQPWSRSHEPVLYMSSIDLATFEWGMELSWGRYWVLHDVYITNRTCNCVHELLFLAVVSKYVMIRRNNVTEKFDSEEVEL